MSWNYRVIEFVDPDDSPWRAIHEVFYDDIVNPGQPVRYSEYPAQVVSHDGGGNIANLAWVLDRMREALDKPVLVEADFRPAPTGNSGGEP